jgi:protein-disulfide isomerase
MQSRFFIVVSFVLAVVASVASTLLYTKQQTKPVDAAPVAAASAVSSDQLKKAIEEYITNNPEQVINALMAGRAKAEEKQMQEAAKNIVSKKEEIENDPMSPSFGNPKGDVVVVKFNDYNCGYCKKASPDVDALVKADPNVRVVVKEFPILGESSMMFGKAAVAAYKLDPAKYHAFHMALMKSSPRSEEQLYELAETVGYKGDQLKAEMAKPEVQTAIDNTLGLGASIGVQGTPAFIIGGELIRGAVPLDTMKQAVEASRKKKNS